MFHSRRFFQYYFYLFFFFRLRREDLRVCDIFSFFYTADLLFELFTRN